MLSSKCIGGSPYPGNPFVRWERQVTPNGAKKAMPVKPLEQGSDEPCLIGQSESELSEMG